MIDVSGTAYTMARDMWIQEHGEPPKASDEAAFIELVRRCVDALRNMPKAGSTVTRPVKGLT